MAASPRIKKILVIPSWYPSEQNPLDGIFVREQAECLARRFAVTVLTPRFPPLKDLLSLRWGPSLLQETKNGLETLRVRYLKTPTLRKFIWSHPDHQLVYYRKFARAIRDGFDHYVRQNGLPDLIHAHVVLPAGWVAVELGRRYGVPVIVTEHTSPFDMYLQSPTQRQIVRDILATADRSLAVGKALAVELRECCPEARIEIVHNLIDTEYFTPSQVSRETASSKAPFRFYFQAILTERKGVKYLLEATRLLQELGFRDFEVRIGGDGPLRRPLQHLADRLGLGANCRFLGRLPRTVLREEMRACDAFVLPSLGECFGIVLGEAMACGKPVLSTFCGGPEEVVTPDTGILVRPGNAQELAQAMADFLSGRFAFEPNRVRNSIVERFGHEAFLERNTALYDDVLERRQGVTAARAA